MACAPECQAQISTGDAHLETNAAFQANRSRLIGLEM